MSEVPACVNFLVSAFGPARAGGCVVRTRERR